VDITGNVFYELRRWKMPLSRNWRNYRKFEVESEGFIQNPSGPKASGETFTASGESQQTGSSREGSVMGRVTDRGTKWNLAKRIEDFSWHPGRFQRQPLQEADEASGGFEVGLGTFPFPLPANDAEIRH